MFVRKEGIWRATPLLLVLLVVETTDLVFALDSIPAIFAITRDAFIVYTSNIFAILGLRAFYFLLAGVLPYFRYLGTGLSLVLMFIGVKMLGEHWVPIPTHISLAVVGLILSAAIVASVLAAHAEARGKPKTRRHSEPKSPHTREWDRSHYATLIQMLADPSAEVRAQAAGHLYTDGCQLTFPMFNQWMAKPELASLLVHRPPTSQLEITVGVGVTPQNFEAIRKANGSPRLADVPAAQDAKEFELHFPDRVRLDILTTRQPGGNGAIARFLEKFGEGIQQVECETSNVDRATQLLRENFGLQPVYPATRAGAYGTRVNFFLVTTPESKKVLIELVETPASA
jgi:hypothetical protein